jgi:hypothetical protein
MSRKRIVVRTPLPLSRMAAFWIQNAAMRDNICRDGIMIAIFPDYTMRSRLRHRFLVRWQCSPAYTIHSAPLYASSPPSIPREARHHQRHGSVAGSPAAAISSRDRSKPRNPMTFYIPLTSENRTPSIFVVDPKYEWKLTPMMMLCMLSRHCLETGRNTSLVRAAGLVDTSCIFIYRISLSFS